MRIVLAHPGQQHSFKVASALKKNGVLYKYITSIYDSPHSLSMRLLRLCLGNEDKKRLLKRRDSFLDGDVVTYYTVLSLCVIVLSRYKYTKRFSYYLDRKIADAFGVLVAKYAIKHNVDAVICFSMNETRCFEYLNKHAPGIIRIVDCANSPVKYMRHIYDHDKFREELKKEVPSFWNDNELDKQQRGIDSTQFFLAPSSFVNHGLEFCGVDPNRIFTLHYGSNFGIVEEPNYIVRSSIVRLVYVGQVTYRKGLPYLIEAFSKINNDNVVLDIIGGWKTNSTIYQMNRNNPRITFYGHVNHDTVKKLLRQSDIFVFASLTEGFSLSVLEAMSMGLPVICSTNCGTNDIVIDGYNGYTFDYDDVERLSTLINLFVDQRELKETLGRHAYETAIRYTWDNYSKNLDTIIKKIDPHNT